MGTISINVDSLYSKRAYYPYIPAPVIMEWTGHSDYKAMKPYIKIVDAAKIENMAKFDAFGSDDKTPEK